jgi:haloacetate dehalogenase
VSSWFLGFKKEKIKLENNGFGEVDITLRHGGKGEPLLLLHGNPMSHITWHKIVDELKDKFYIVASDLRGYGESIGPEEGGQNHINYSFRA